jgi:hypothetical protein
MDKGIPGHIQPGPFNQLQLAALWLDWVAQLGGVENHELVLLVPESVVLPESIKAWKKVLRLTDRHKISSWPQGPNASFQQIIWWMALRKITEPVFWMEADAIPLKPHWIDAWEEEYRTCGKPFMGGFMPDTPGLCPAHMTGIAIYPPNSAQLAPKLLQARDSAWDVWAAPDTIPKMHATKLLQHAWQHGPITTVEEYKKEIDPAANIFHTDKFGALIKLMRSQREGQVEEPEASKVIRKVFGTEEVPGSVAILPGAHTVESVLQLIRDVIKTEKDRIKLMEFLRDGQYLLAEFGRGRQSREPKHLARSHGRA